MSDVLYVKRRTLRRENTKGDTNIEKKLVFIMSKRVSHELEVSEQTRGDERRFIIIEYEVTRKEINRYDVVMKEMK